MQIIGTFGRAVGVNPDAVILEDATKSVLLADLSIMGGTPMALYKDTDDVVKIASYKWLIDNSKAANIRVHGIAKFSKNSYIDETFDKLGTFGSGKGTVMQMGRITVLNNAYTTADGVVTTFAFDTTKTYLAGEALYVNLDAESDYLGKITNVLVSDTEDVACNTGTLVGYVSGFYASATQPVLEITLK